MNAHNVRLALDGRFRNKEYAVFNELRDDTNGDQRTTIDYYAVGLWNADLNVYAIEIKVSRGDFTHDAAQFHTKQKAALAYSTQFYYCVPSGLIDKSEVPEEAGLMVILDSGLTRVLKQAPVRKMETVPPGLLRSLARRTEDERNRSNFQHIFKFLGRERTAEEIEKYIAEQVKLKRDSDFFNKVSEEIRLKKKEIEEEAATNSVEVRNLLEIKKEVGLNWRIMERLNDIIKFLDKRDSYKIECGRIVGILDDFEKLRKEKELKTEEEHVRPS